MTDLFFQNSLMIASKDAFSANAIRIFNRAITEYHLHDDVDQPYASPFPEGSIEEMLYRKCWIDTVQWHLEDIIRDPGIDPSDALSLKRRIDKSNQDRTDLVEQIDTYFLDKYKDVTPEKEAQLNTESPAWAIDRLSILQLKIYHMTDEANREGITPEKRAKVRAKLSVLLEQNEDLPRAIDELLEDYATGHKVMKVYRQMKMYNDPSLNPVLYAKGK